MKIVHESIRARSVKELQQDGNTAIEPGRMDGFCCICLLCNTKCKLLADTSKMYVNVCTTACSSSQLKTFYVNVVVAGTSLLQYHQPLLCQLPCHWRERDMERVQVCIVKT